MRFKIDIDCTPAEARTFFGLPDLEPMQQEILKEVENRIKKRLALTDPETLLRGWMPGTAKGFQDFWSAILGQASSAGAKRGKPADGKRSKSGGSKGRARDQDSGA